MKRFTVAIIISVIVAESSSYHFDNDYATRSSNDWEVVEQSIDVEISEVNSTDDNEANAPGGSSHHHKDTIFDHDAHQDRTAQHRAHDQFFDGPLGPHQYAFLEKDPQRLSTDPVGNQNLFETDYDIEDKTPPLSYSVNAIIKETHLPRDTVMKKLEGKMKNGTAMVIFKKPSYMDVVDSQSADLIFATKSWTPYKNLFFELVIKCEDDDSYMVPNIKGTSVRNHGTHRLQNARPGAYFVTARAYRIKKDGEREDLGEGITFFFVHESIYSERLSQVFLGLVDKKTDTLKRLDKEKLRPGKRQIGWVRDEENEVDDWRLDIYTIRGGKFSRIIITSKGQVDAEKAQQDAQESVQQEKLTEDGTSITESSDSKDGVEENDQMSDYDDNDSELKPVINKEQIDEMLIGQHGKELCYAVTHHFFEGMRKRDEFFPAAVYIMMTGRRYDKNKKAVLVEWGRVTVYGFLNKIFKNAALTVAIAAFIAVDVAANYGALGAFGAISTLATKGFVFVKVEIALWGTDECIYQ